MEKQAAELMGEPVLAGTTAASAGHSLKAGLTAGAVGVLGGAVGAAVGTALSPTFSKGSGEDLQNYKGLMFVAVTQSSVGFFAAKTGLLKPSIKGMLAAVPRANVQSFEIGGGLVPPLTVTLTDGTVFKLEVPRISKGKAEKVRALLQGG